MNPNNPSPATLDTLNFYHTSLELLQVCTPLLADVCHLSIPQVRHALPSMVKAVIYQCLGFIQTQGQATFISEILQSKTLAPLTFNEKFGLNSALLERLKSEFIPFRQRLFEGKSDNFAWLIGLLTERTGLTVQQTIALFDKTALLTLKLLADIRTLATTAASKMLLTPPLTQSQFFDWFKLQPMLMASLDDKGLIHVLAYQSEKTLGQSLKQQAKVYHNPLPTAEQLSLASVILHYKNTQPLGIVPHEFLAKPKRPAAAVAQTFAKNPAASTFTPDTPFIQTTITPKPSWQHTLQRHWMLTAGVLTGLVFGGIALLTPPKDKPKTDITHQQALEQAKAMPHDVAIIKIDSTAASTETPTPTAVSSVLVTNFPKSASSAVAKTHTDTHTDTHTNTHPVSKKAEITPQKTPTKTNNPAKDKDNNNNNKSPDKKPAQNKGKSNQQSDNANKADPKSPSKKSLKPEKSDSNKTAKASNKSNKKASAT